MSHLLLLASFAAGLALLSLAGMVALILGRVMRAHVQQSAALSRREILMLLTTPRDGDAAVRAHVARAARRGALATIVLEVLGVVRGEARIAFLARLANVGAAAYLRRGLRRGCSADRLRATEALEALGAPQQARLRA
jgi:hypothetical protein